MHHECSFYRIPTVAHGNVGWHFAPTPNPSPEDWGGGLEVAGLFAKTGEGDLGGVLGFGGGTIDERMGLNEQPGPQERDGSG